MERLTRRADFLAAREGVRVHGPAFVLQARPRGDAAPARLGLTVSRKVGSAVERNRVRRRLRATATSIDATCVRPGYDYVIVGRRAALTYPFGRLAEDLADAFRRATRGKSRAPRSRGAGEYQIRGKGSPHEQPRTDESLA